MRVYVRIDSGIVAEIIEPRAYEEEGPIDETTGLPEWNMGDEIPIEQRYHPDFVSMLVDVTEVTPQPSIGWKTVGDHEFQSPKPDA